MKKQLEFYNSQIEIHSQKVKSLNQKLVVSSILRTLVFLSICLVIYFFWGDRNVIFPAILVGIALFLFLVSRHTDLKELKLKEKKIIELNGLEIKILTTRGFHHLPNGKEFEIDQHAFAQDIDLFGKGSFFQYINRTALLEGKRRLAAMLQENAINEISEKQVAIKELAKKGKWRQEFTATAHLIEKETAAQQVLNWFNEYKTFVPSYMKWLPNVITILSIIVITAYALSYINDLQLLTYYFLSIFFTGIYLKKINLLSEHTEKIQGIFNQYHKLLALLENEEFDSEILKRHKDLIRTKDKKASEVFKNFSKAIDAFNQRRNLIFGFIGNGFMMWDFRYSYKLEKWIEENRDKVGNWFEILEITDAYNSLGNFAFNHPGYTFPTLVSEHKLISVTNLSHPLLNPEKAVKNDFKISEEQFYIITGANMAGKSTFLRTVSLQIVMTNLGLPVCADSCNYKPIKLITSMRTTDSLTEDESYFFSELKRLQYIVNQIKEDRYFIILDEILKGTNSTDKAIGSRKFIQKLVGSRSTGIIATHDLSLCEVASELPQVENHYFDAEIIDDELHFDYKFKEGICQNMNASFLLKKMKIVD